MREPSIHDFFSYGITLSYIDFMVEHRPLADSYIRIYLFWFIYSFRAIYSPISLLSSD